MYSSASLTFTSALLHVSCRAVGKSLDLGTTDVLTSVPDAFELCQTSLEPAEALQKAKKLFKVIAKDPGQSEVVSAITSSIRADEDQCFFVHGPAGTGKSTIANYITFSVLAAEKTVLNLATTGQAALQLPFGATAHSVCKIPISDEDVLTCTLGMNSDGARKLAAASVLQWDEWPNAKRSAWDSVLALLEQIKQQHPQLWKSKVIICYGDFRQIPPVLKGGTRDSIVNNSVCKSSSWARFISYGLAVHHRQQEDREYAAWIERIGDGTISARHCLSGEPGYISLDLCGCLYSEAATINFCFDALNDPHSCATKKILCPTNAAVDAFNTLVLDKLTKVYLLAEFIKHSADSIEYDHGHTNIESHMTAEFLHLQNENGVPPHALRLVVGALYQLVRNFSAADRLMNHTHVILRAVHANHLLIETLDGRCFPLPRICFRWPLARGTTNIIRRQYPLRLAYASTFNGAQGSTLIRCVLDSRTSPFTHGHLYVALSRVQDRHSIRVLTSLERCTDAGIALTKNIVWKELLLLRQDTQNHGRLSRQCRKRPAAN